MTKWIRNLKFILAAALVFPLISAGNQVSAQPVSNDQEIKVTGNLFRPLGQRGGVFGGGVSYGWYMNNPAWQVGIRQGLNIDWDRDSSDHWVATTVPFVDYHFLNWGRYVPFVGGFLGAVWNDRDIEGTIGPEAGLKAYMDPNTFVSAQYRYEWFFDKLDSGSIRDTSSANHVGTIGIGYTWGGAGQRATW
jgi:hypothetical protein